MSGKPRKRKGKFKQQSRANKKGRHSPGVIAQQQKTTPPSESVVAGIPDEAPVSSTTAETQVITKNPELFFELRRIGIFAGIMLVSLILLAIFLD